MNNQVKGKKKKRSAIRGLTTGIKVILVLAAMAAVVLAVLFIVKSGGGTEKSVIYNVSIEAGEELTPSMFVFGGSSSAEFYGDMDYDTLIRTPGIHELKLLFDGQIYTVNLSVNDTVSPTGSVMPVIYKLGTVADPSVMVYDVNDVTDVDISFDHSPNMAVEGRQNVTVKLTDMGGNTRLINGTVYVTEDINMPVWEIGTKIPQPSDFSKSIKDAIFQSTSVFTSIKSPGKYYAALRVSIGGISDSFYAPFEAIDTTSPILKPKENIIYDINKTLPTAEELIEECIEYSDVTISYAEKYTIPAPGVYALTIEAVDAAGNKSTVVVTVTAIDGKVDNGAPIITVSSDILLTVGSKYDLSKYVAIYDDKDGEILLDDTSKVTINQDDVNLMVPGSYRILVTATDNSGKVANATVTVVVSHVVISDNDIKKALDKYLVGIINNDMTREEKIKAVFDSIVNNEKTNFNGKSDKSNDSLLEAYYGVTFMYGDSYTTACTINHLLERLEIPSVIVERLGGKSLYYWNLVDFGDGWYHLDGGYHDVKWVIDGEEKPTYKLTDDEIIEYTEWYNEINEGTDYYSFNSPLYPHTPVKSDQGYIYLPYNVIYIVTDGGSIEGLADQQVIHGNLTTTVKAVPAPGFKFVKWSDGVMTAERSDIITGDFTVTAEFKQQSSVITKTYIFVYSAGVGGNVEGSLKQTVKSGLNGGLVKAVANEGFRFVGWSDGVTTAERSDIAMDNLAVVALFAPNDGSNYVLEYKSVVGGIISGDPIQVVGENVKGKEVVAQPLPGYIFNGWSDGVTTPARCDLVSSNLTVTAYFVKGDAVLYTVNYVAGEGGSIKGMATQKVEAGTGSVTVTAVADRGYVFAGWSDGVTTAMRNDVVVGDTTYTATFVKLTPVNVSYAADGGFGYIEGVPVQQIYAGETTTLVRAVANYGYRFIGWSDGVLTPERSDSVGVDTTFIAVFEELESFTVVYSSGEGGSISGKTTQNVYVGMQTETVTAIALDGYRFVMWSDGVTTAERSDTVNGMVEYTALFEPLTMYTVKYEAGVGGQVNGSTEQSLYQGETFELVEAVPFDGFEFVMWSDGVLTAVRQDVSSEDATYTAIFAPVKVCSIYYTATLGGTIVGEATQTVFIGQTGSAVTATAIDGYTFVGWSDGVTSPERFDVASNEVMNFTAIFAPIQ